MEGKKKYKRKKIKLFLFSCIIGSITILSVLIFFLFSKEAPVEEVKITPEQLFKQYMSYISLQKYEEMYNMISYQSQQNISQEEFIARHRNIYEGIDARNLEVKITQIRELNDKQTIIGYDTTMDTLAGELNFSNEVTFTKNENKEYCLEWSSWTIFPTLNNKDKIRVATVHAERGTILDRNNNVLAGKGIACSIGFVPGKMGGEKEKEIKKLAKLLEVSKETIEKKLNASYVKADTFVPIKIVPKEEQNLQKKVSAIQGVKIVEVEVRTYPLKEKASHLTGYVQNINAEELKELKGQDYNINSIIGKTGLEKLYEERLRGIDGCEITIVDKEGKKKEILLERKAKDGENIKLTIDSRMQTNLYYQFSQDNSCSVVINPITGEVLALVSTPSFDANDFVFGMSTQKWDSLNNDENKPLYNRYRATWCPGSSFKSVIAAVGITTQKLDPKENFGSSGLSWQKDKSWGSYKITTLKTYGNQVNLKNALIYSDNIYFAKAALKIGADTLAKQLGKIGFNEKMPFELDMQASQFSNEKKFNSEVQLADSGYGQGQVLVNPLHMASIYSAFVNDGNMINPYLEYKEELSKKYWKKKAFSKEAADIVKEDLIQVVENPEGTAHSAKLNKVTIAGKTGTAEIKSSKEDKKGTELGWFNAFTTDDKIENPLLIVSMVEDVKERGGSHYVLPKIKAIFQLQF